MLFTLMFKRNNKFSICKYPSEHLLGIQVKLEAYCQVTSCRTDITHKCVPPVRGRCGCV